MMTKGWSLLLTKILERHPQLGWWLGAEKFVENIGWNMQFFIISAGEAGCWAAKPLCNREAVARARSARCERIARSAIRDLIHNFLVEHAIFHNSRWFSLKQTFGALSSAELVLVVCTWGFGAQNLCFRSDLVPFVLHLGDASITRVVHVLTSPKSEILTSLTTWTSRLGFRMRAKT